MRFFYLSFLTTTLTYLTFTYIIFTYIGFTGGFRLVYQWFTSRVDLSDVVKLGKFSPLDVKQKEF